MNIVIAIDSLKGSLTSLEAGQAISDGIKGVYPDATVEIRPLADGGEGTVEALTIGMNGALESVEVTGPLGKKVTAKYGIVAEGSKKIAILAMAQAAGITLVSEKEKNPLETTTYGVGEMIKDAIKKGCRHFIVGIGGSATNDGGIGMLQALGFKILNKDGNQVPFGAKGLGEIVSIDDTEVIEELKECTFKVACDVTNPLCGQNGASAIFGPQKGATPSMVVQMDNYLKKYAKICREKYSHADREYPGTGAAGGLGYAFKTFTNSTLESGVKIVLDETKLESYIKNADLVITGEGRLDSQTIMGKAPIGVAKLAKNYDKPVIAFSGCVTNDATVCNEHGIDAFFPILRKVQTLEEVLDTENAKFNMTSTVTQVFKLIKLTNKF